MRDHPPSSPSGTTACPGGTTACTYYVSGVTFGLPRGRTVNLFAKPARISGVTSLHSVPARIGPAARRFGPSLLRLAAGGAVLWFLVQRVGAGPFKDWLRAVTSQAVAAAVALTAL